MTEFTVKEVTVFRIATFWMKHSAKRIILEIYEICNYIKLTVQIWTAKCDFTKEW